MDTHEQTTLPNLTFSLHALDELFNLQNQELGKPLVPYRVLIMIHIVMSAFWVILSLAGLTANFINIRTFLKIGLDDSVTVSFFALAISDFDVCSIAFVEMITFIIYLFENELQLWFYLPPLISTFFLMCVRRIFNITTIVITTFLAIQRCICVIFPFHVKLIFTKTRTIIFLVITFSFCIICQSLYTWRHQVVRTTNTLWNRTQLVVYVPPGSEPYLLLTDVVIAIGLNMSCQIIVIVCLFIMGVSLKKSARFRETAATNVSTNVKDVDAPETRKDKTMSKEKQAMIQVALVSAIFVVTNSPYFVYGIANSFIPGLGINKRLNNLYHLLHNIMFTAELLNSSVNFIVYYKYNSRFKSYCFK